ncbi:MAG: tetratricopeptide repeat protein [Acidobacteriaceae bacterium]|nr:tetratricopeptide repeat protein [Acidobacteriaceae bacterium]
MRHILISSLLLSARSLLAQSHSDDRVALVQSALALQQAGNYAGAADAYRKILELQPDDVATHVNLGVVLVSLGRFDDAIVQYEAAEKLLPGDSRIAMNIALAYEKSGRLAEAAERFEKLHASIPGDEKVTMLLADCSLQLGRDQRVIDLLLPLEADQSDLTVAYMLGMALLRSGRIPEGQVLLDRILRNGDSPEAHFLLGTRMFESGDYPAAVKEFASAVELNPKVPLLQSFYGQALLSTGDPDGAAEAFRKELATNANDFRSNLGLAQILTARKQCGEAMPFVQRALLVQPDSPAAKFTLAECVSGHTPAQALSHASDPGPKLESLAPDFKLVNASSGKEVRLRDFRGKRPVVIVFGSYSCPNFRSSANALTSMYRRHGSQIAFLLIYIREAHAAGDWQSTRNQREEIVVPPARNFSEKQEHASMCTRKLRLPFPALVDGMDGAVEKAYNAWPSRAFVIARDGRILYATRLTELDFHPQELESALREQAAGMKND